jgi:uncharacterized membrane protein YgdD (TMEM256/DUF423 family)
MSAPRPGIRRAFGAAGAVCAALGVALAAIGAHALDDAQSGTRLATAASFLLWHGLALLLLAPRQRDRVELCALGVLLCGTLLFCGSLALAAFFGVPTTLAPLGGSLLIAGWLLQALAAVRR